MIMSKFICILKRTRHNVIIMINLKALLTTICILIPLNYNQAEASTLTPVDLKTPSLGISFISPSLSFDFPITANLFTGISSSLPIYYPFEFFGTIRYELHFVYQLIKEKDSNLSFGAIAGVWGDHNFTQSKFSKTLISLQLGFGVSYKFTEQLNGRINFVAALPASQYGILAPSAGFELVYCPTSNLELSAGINGQGDLLGARWKF